MKFSKTGIIAIALAILYSVGLIYQACRSTPEEAEALRYPELGYEETIFDPSYVHIIDIHVSQADWNKLKREAMSKECIDGTVVIDGEQVQHVGVRTKGNSTLMLNAAKGWDRFSLALEFDAFQESQRYHGLDCLSLYNNMFDASCMKTYLCYEMMRSMGVSTPLCSFAAVHLNGEFIGMYSASEIFSESFALRNFGVEYGNIYKPEQFDIAAILTGELQNTKINFDAFAGGSGEKFTIDSALAVSNEAVRLAYLGESLYAYEDIWRNTSFPIGISDKERLVTALRRIHDNEAPEEVVDIDALARYFAVNTFVLNTDCYTTGMAHNYGLYEKDGILTMLPWDYDVALGNISSEFGITDPTVFINQPIDTPVFSTTVEERPLLNVLLSSERGRELYYGYLAELVDKWITSGMMEHEIARIADMIGPWVQRESVVIHSYDDFLLAVDSIDKFTAYRGESVLGQLSGEIPSTWDTQTAAPEALPDYSDYSPPAGGMMAILLPDAESDEISGSALLQILPEANKNMKDTVNILALLNMVDWGQLLSTDFSQLSSGDHSDVSTDDLIAAVMPFPFILLRILLTAVAVPIVIICALRFVRRRKEKKGGIRHVV
ncbi:MAG: CotH kinase family protein [Oscillospiraceae bacterium]|nr:CotH kinase family protein [Oscillospiraceae bacterium]